jgi:hypothetical protein
MKTPKEKAEELVDKFSGLVDFTNDHDNTCYKSTLKRQKQCALICVDEIINSLPDHLDMAELYYWKEVKKEIELL